MGRREVGKRAVAYPLSTMVGSGLGESKGGGIRGRSKEGRCIQKRGKTIQRFGSDPGQIIGVFKQKSDRVEASQGGQDTVGKRCGKTESWERKLGPVGGGSDRIMLGTTPVSGKTWGKK